MAAEQLSKLSCWFILCSSDMIFSFSSCCYLQDRNQVQTPSGLQAAAHQDTMTRRFSCRFLWTVMMSRYTLSWPVDEGGIKHSQHVIFIYLFLIEGRIDQVGRQPVGSSALHRICFLSFSKPVERDSASELLSAEPEPLGSTICAPPQVFLPLHPESTFNSLL